MAILYFSLPILLEQPLVHPQRLPTPDSGIDVLAAYEAAPRNRLFKILHNTLIDQGGWGGGGGPGPGVGALSWP